MTDAPRAWWTVHFEVVTLSETHLGAGGAAGPVGHGLLRDEQSGLPMIAGTTMAGLLRERLANTHCNRREREQAGVHTTTTALLGGAQGDDAGEQSRAIVFDATCTSDTPAMSVRRDGVALTGDGVAKSHRKFDHELWPRGLRFAARVDVAVEDSMTNEAEGELIGSLGAALSLVDRPDCGLGARSSRGWGRCKVDSVSARRFDLSTSAGWDVWLLHDPDDTANQPPTFGDPIDALAQAADDPVAASVRTTAGDLVSAMHQHDDLEVRIPLGFPNGLLVRSPNSGAGPDVTYLRSLEDALLPGTAIAGSLRHHAARVLDQIGFTAPAAARLVEHLFGSDADNPDLHEASRVRVADSIVADGAGLVVTRVKLDRLTQGAVEHALVSEEVHYDGSTEIVMHLLDDGSANTSSFDHETLCGLVVLLAKEIVDDIVSFGGTSAYGRGRVSPTPHSAMTIRGPGVDVQIPLTPRPDAAKQGAVMSDEPLATLNSWVDALHESSTHHAQGAKT